MAEISTWEMLAFIAVQFSALVVLTMLFGKGEYPAEDGGL